MIAVEGLTIRFDPGTPMERRALQDVTFTVDEHEFCCIIGPNGAGKSTLLAAIAGDVMPQRGRILIADRDIRRLSPRARAGLVARVFQDPLAGGCSQLTIVENLALAARRGKWRGFGDALARQRTRLIYERVAELQIGLEQKLDQPMGSLSAGHRQALALVMATLAPSSVMLLDAHTATLDAANAAFVMELTTTLAKRFSLTVLMVMPSMRRALELGTRTIVLHEGRIILDVRDPERRELTMEGLIARFRRAQGGELDEDELLSS